VREAALGGPLYYVQGIATNTRKRV